MVKPCIAQRARSLSRKRMAVTGFVVACARQRYVGPPRDLVGVQMSVEFYGHVYMPHCPMHILAELHKLGGEGEGGY